MNNYEKTESANKDIAAGPHGWIQWKGTNVCMDLHCACGFHGHVDTDFLYYAKCGECGKTFSVSPYVRLVPVDDTEDSQACEVFK